MKSSFCSSCVLALVVLLAGCISPYYEQGSETNRQETDIQYLKDNVSALKQRVEAVEKRLEERDSETQKGSMEKEIRELKETVAALDRALKASDSVHADLRREIILDLSKRISDMLQAQSPPPKGSGSRGGSSQQVKGREHIVQPGETLTKIAATYRVKPSAIIEANGIDRPSSIRAGQKLVIPE
jgi:septal ring factor EnvC (AmiA/AmiB activator)